MLTAQVFAAHKAQAVGLIDTLYTDIDAAVNETMTQFEPNSSPAMRQTKRLLRQIKGQSISPKVIAATLEAIANIRVTEDAHHRMHQFLSRKSS